MPQAPYASFHHSHHGSHPHIIPNQHAFYPPYQPYPAALPPQPSNGPLIVSSYPQHQLPALLPIRQIPPPRRPSSSTHSQAIASPSSNSSTSLYASTVRALPSPPAAFSPPLPWLSVPELPFPPRAPRRRKKRRAPQLTSSSLELPSLRKLQGTDTDDSVPDSHTSTIAAASGLETPLTSLASSEVESVQPSTPLSATLPPSSSANLPSPTQGKGPIRPIIPILPAIPNLPTTPKHVTRDSLGGETPKPLETRSSTFSPSAPDEDAKSPINSTEQDSATASLEKNTNSTPAHSSLPPKSWADLVRSKNSKVVPNASLVPTNGNTLAGDFGAPKTTSIADALNSFSIEKNDADGSKISFLEPRGLVNTGNMCYMNSVLQILVFCVPFYDFLNRIGKRAAHSFKSDTPLIGAMIMFMREFSVIDSAISVEQLRMRLKDGELEQYGAPFTPEFVYDVIKRLPRFSSMRRGHQQDAEEFLGFLLEGLHDECVQVLKGTPASGVVTPTNGAFPLSLDSSFEISSPQPDDGWLEVGPKQKPSITRSSGTITTESPITKIFGGKLRSELRVPGLKNSVTLEPYQPLQLDIQSPDVQNISDALKGLTRSETLHGDFNSPRGPDVTATKQVFIETLPPVLILHLKRFEYNNAGGTQKIWKKIGYPLELEIPKEVFSPQKRGGLTIHNGLPKYRLIGVVYHHGKNASGGHYTVDVRRQDGREWVRLDDTVIRRVRSQDVAQGGNQIESKVSVAKFKNERSPKSEMDINFDGNRLNEANENGTDENGWKQVNGGANGREAWSNIANTSDDVPPTWPKNSNKDFSHEKFSVKDSKVAYILFYQKI
ncbi:MAG: hypothetical protein M1829_000080 [Trizodia sp. TS-e1964]|nr:MAG: hypothetical protein M1829_000080 [Trizodia sp. TS-e1964]